MEKKRKVVFEVTVEADSTKEAIATFDAVVTIVGQHTVFGNEIAFNRDPVRNENFNEEVEKLTEEFSEASPTDEPVEEKPLKFNPTNEEYDAIPTPELKPTKKGIAVEDPHLRGRGADL